MKKQPKKYRHRCIHCGKKRYVTEMKKVASIGATKALWTCKELCTVGEIELL